MPRNRLEELASLYMENALPLDCEQEFLDLLSEPDAQEFLAQNLYIDRLIHAIKPHSKVSGQVMRIVEDSDPSFADRVMRLIEAEQKTAPQLRVVEGKDITEGTYRIPQEAQRPKKPKFVSENRIPIPTHTRRSAIMAIAASVVLIFGLAVLGFFKSDTGEIVDIAQLNNVRGEVKLRRGSEEIRIRKTTLLREGDVVVTAEGASVQVTYPSKQRKYTTFLLKEASTLKFDGHQSGKNLRLIQGSLLAEVAPQKYPMRLITPHAVATVLGTRFLLKSGEDTTRLEVAEGKVRLEPLNAPEQTVVSTNEYGDVNRSAGSLVKGVLQDKLGAISGFSLISTKTNLPVEGFDPLFDGAVISLSQLPSSHFGVQAKVMHADGGSIRFVLRDESDTIIGNMTSNLPSSNSVGTTNDSGKGDWDLKPGVYTLEATPYSQPDGLGQKGYPVYLFFTIVD